MGDKPVSARPQPSPERIDKRFVVGALVLACLVVGGVLTLGLGGTSRAEFRPDDAAEPSAEESTSAAAQVDIAERTRLVSVHDGHGRRVNALVELPDGRIASTSEDGTIQVWDPSGNGDRGDPLSHYFGTEQRALAVLDDGRLVVAGNSSVVHVWDPANPDLDPAVYSGHEWEAVVLVAMSNGQVASASRDGTVQIWDPDDPSTTFATYVGHGRTVYAMTELPDGRIASAGEGGEGEVHVWDPRDVDSPASIYDGHKGQGGGLLHAMVTLPDGRVASHGPGGLRVWNPTTLDTDAAVDIYALGHSGVNDLLALADGRIAIPSREGEVLLVDLDRQAAVDVIDTTSRGDFESLIELSNGSIVAGRDDGRVVMLVPS